MTRLPDAHRAIIEQRKITAYLLASGHPVSRAKAAFVTRFGFDPAVWQTLRDALLKHARGARVVSIGDSVFGRKYTLEARSLRRMAVSRGFALFGSFVPARRHLGS